jgi:hypothetical protein
LKIINLYLSYKILFKSGKKYILPSGITIFALIFKSFQNIKKYSKERFETSIILKISQELLDILKFQGKTYNYVYKEWRPLIIDGRHLLYLLKKRKTSSIYIKKIRVKKKRKIYFFRKFKKYNNFFKKSKKVLLI